MPAAPSLPLAFDQARLSPCAGCAAPCCTVLPVYDFDVRGLPDIDYALYLCNFERIELAINEVGGWRVHYRAPCRQLDPVERRCTVHGSPDQPRVCQKYDAHACFYTSIFSAAGSPRMVRMDRGRVLAWAAACAFGEDRAPTSRAISLRITEPASRKLAVSAAGDLNNDGADDFVTLTWTPAGDLQLNVHY